MDSEKTQFITPVVTVTTRPQPRRPSTLSKVFITLAAGLLSTLFLIHLHASCPHHQQLRKHIDVEAVQQCSIDNLKSDLWFLDDAVPIEPEEFLERRDRLAKALAVNGVDAFVLEPGYTFQ